MIFNFSILRSSFAASFLFVAAFFYANSFEIKAQSSNRSAEAVGNLSAKERKPVAVTLADLQNRRERTLEEAERFLNDLLKMSK